MAEKNTLARPYAKAAFEFASQTTTFAEWSTVLNVLALIANDPRVVELLKDRSIPVTVIVDFFKGISENFVEKNEHYCNFIAILAQQNRLKVLPEIRKLYEEMRANAEKTAEVHFVTAISLNEAEREMFKKMLEQYLSRTVIMHPAVDKSLLGGYVATSGNYVIDGSVRGYLTNLKETMGE